jgi:hypothetical protein
MSRRLQYLIPGRRAVLRQLARTEYVARQQAQAAQALRQQRDTLVPWALASLQAHVVSPVGTDADALELLFAINDGLYGEAADV